MLQIARDEQKVGAIIVELLGLHLDDKNKTKQKQANKQTSYEQKVGAIIVDLLGLSTTKTFMCAS